MDSASDILRDACAVFGCVTTDECAKYATVADTIFLGLTALQHRGQESSGMVISDGKKFLTKHGLGLVASAYDESITQLSGNLGIGHNRYSTVGTSSLQSCQPFVVHTLYGKIAVAHNGELVNSGKIRKNILKQIGLSTESDSEIITQLLVGEPPFGEEKGVNWTSRITNLMQTVECSYSVVLMTSQNEIYSFRDPHGNRPLCLGEIDISHTIDVNEKKRYQNGTVFIVSSESCAFSSIGARYIREVKPGEIVCLTENGIKSCGIINRSNGGFPSFCIFEYVYFARADSVFQGQLVHEVRKQCGRQLAIEGAIDADIVSTIPDSATPAARGFSDQLGIPYEDVVIKNRYVGRTFIQPNTALRKIGVTTKFGPLTQHIVDKKIVLIDDSIVRGNTMPHIVHLLKSAGAKEVHIRIASPPLKHPCFMGINIPTHKELIANHYNEEQLAKHFGADSLVHLSVDGLKKAVTHGIKDVSNVGYCTACLTGKYPVELEW